MERVVEGRALGVRRSARALAWVSRRVGDPLAADVAGRLASILFLLCGALVVIGAALPLPAAGSVAGLFAVGVLAMGVGAVLWVLPWRRWSSRASLAIVVPAALVLID